MTIINRDNSRIFLLNLRVQGDYVFSGPKLSKLKAFHSSSASPSSIAHTFPDTFSSLSHSIWISSPTNMTCTYFTGHWCMRLYGLLELHSGMFVCRQNPSERVNLVPNKNCDFEIFPFNIKV